MDVWSIMFFGSSFFLLIILLVVWKRQRRERQEQKIQVVTRRVSEHITKEQKQGDIYVTDTPTPEIENLLEGVSYFPIPDGIYPRSVEALDEAVKKDLENKIDTIPQMSIDSMRLLRLLLNPESNLKEIVSLVMTHPVLSAKILQAVNSVYFYLPEKVTSVGRAITLLGYNNVRSILFHDVIKTTVAQRAQAESETYLKTWIHSAVVSTCAGLLAKRFYPEREYDIATAGLMHDIGKFYIMGVREKGSVKRDEKADGEVSKLPFLIQEDQLYGVNHAIIGAHIARHWKLPEFIVKGIEYHHHPSFFPPDRIPGAYLIHSFIICLADLICKALGYEGEDNQLLAVLPEYFERFKVDANIKGVVTPEILKSLEKAKATVEAYERIS